MPFQGMHTPSQLVGLLRLLLQSRFAPTLSLHPELHGDGSVKISVFAEVPPMRIDDAGSTDL